MSQKVRKAIIPAAGLGTRFLPFTKSVAKEMLPIVDIPTIQLIVQEAIDSGIEEILIISNSKKVELEKYFTVDHDLETEFISHNKLEYANQIHTIGTMAKVTFIHQDIAKGLGHAILLGKDFIGNEPFAILLGDDVDVNKVPVLKQLINAYEKTGNSVVGVQSVPLSDVSKYGIIKPSAKVSNRLYELCDMVEKPAIVDAPSQMAILGRYVLSSKVFELLETQKPGKGGEIQLTDSIQRLLQYEKVYAYDYEGIRYDVGDRFGYVKAIIDFALQRDDIRAQVAEYIEEKIQKGEK